MGASPILVSFHLGAQFSTGCHDIWEERIPSEPPASHQPKAWSERGKTWGTTGGKPPCRSGPAVVVAWLLLLLLLLLGCCCKKPQNSGRDCNNSNNNNNNKKNTSMEFKHVIYHQSETQHMISFFVMMTSCLEPTPNPCLCNKQETFSVILIMRT